MSRNIGILGSDPNFNSHPWCEKLNVTHLMFTDDLLLFSRADTISVTMLFQAFKKFSLASGLEANLEKRNVYIGGNKVFKQQIIGALQIPVGDFPFRYLGVPLSTKNLIVV